MNEGRANARYPVVIGDSVTPAFRNVSYLRCRRLKAIASKDPPGTTRRALSTSDSRSPTRRKAWTAAGDPRFTEIRISEFAISSGSSRLRSAGRNPMSVSSIFGPNVPSGRYDVAATPEPDSSPRRRSKGTRHHMSTRYLGSAPPTLHRPHDRAPHRHRRRRDRCADPRPGHPGLGRPQLHLGCSRPVRERWRLVHQHRQRLLRRPAVRPVHLGRLRWSGVRRPRRRSVEERPDRRGRAHAGRPGMGLVAGLLGHRPVPPARASTCAAPRRVPAARIRVPAARAH